MAQDNQIVIVGNLTRDPELRYTPNGAALVKFGIAWSKRAPDESGQWRDVETSFFNVTAWRQLAENVAETLTQGSRVVVVGRLRTNSWETPEGERRAQGEDEGEGNGASPQGATAKNEKQGRAPGRGGLASGAFGGGG